MLRTEIETQKDRDNNTFYLVNVFQGEKFLEDDYTYNKDAADDMARAVEALAAFGFYPTMTGGGCKGLERQTLAGHEMITIADDPSLPQFSKAATWSNYDDKGEMIRAIVFDNVQAIINKLENVQ